ncbi:MAG: hypothetical protein O4805_24690 [Trichodesmium sp. St16_bin2-tuft]|nr:hypothetical protein [Trichodesmium sp. MAG_R02]MDE5090151.1 hypothetical protein [Trichodesmium sp. St16_bin2-tuft]MDE5112095.1 hypothetical protein [Trichodesmium sp. St7_bin2_1]MDE5118365.1 hypothetical protein [Trichodesmium sp. St2_bin2_1]MDE5124631.1 hypothetical protein [Trichodesmium sp. St19_bin1]
MHARSLQGFGYGDVVHQFENRYNTKFKKGCYSINLSTITMQIKSL